MPTYTIERKAGGRVAGVDEVGRGPLAGPVLAAAVIFTDGVPRRVAAMIDDSKKLVAAERDAAFAVLLAMAARGKVQIAVGAASVSEIDRINILHAAMLAMRRAVARLPSAPDLALIDGNRAPPVGCATRCVVGGDAISLSIAAASIVAKVLRDRGMSRLGTRCPGYGWEVNAGYATRDHRAALRLLGPTHHHRAAFGTVRRMAEDARLADAAD